MKTTKNTPTMYKILIAAISCLFSIFISKFKKQLFITTNIKTK